MDDYDPITTTLEFSENVDGTGPSRMLHHDWHNDGVNSFDRMNGNSATHGGPDGNRQPGSYNGITPIPSGTVLGTGLRIDVTVGNDGDTGWNYSGSGSISISFSGGQPNEGEGYNVGDTFTINVGEAGDNTAGVHTFVSPAAANGIKKQDGTLKVNVGSAEATVLTPSAASYNPTTGNMVLTMAGHGFSDGQKIRLAKE